MIIGVPKEIKNRENRVALVPAGARMLTEAGHRVLVQRSAGLGAGLSDEQYERAGAKLVDTAHEAWGSEMVIKVKEPLADEFKFLRPNLILFTYLHLAAEKELTTQLMEKKVTGIAYETVQEKDRSLPLLRPMSEVAGRMAVQVGAYYLQSSWEDINSGKGILLGGVPGVAPGKVVVIGGGVAGSNAAMVALGMGANVTIIDQNLPRLEYLEHIFKGRLTTLMSNTETIEESVRHADLVIGSVLLPGARAPKLVTSAMVRQMTPGSVIVDIAVDQGGCVETCRPTSHEKPTYMVDHIVHYCVTNMPGAVAHTSAFALTNSTLKYILAIAAHGPEKAAKQSPAIQLGFNTYQGKLVQQAVADSHQLPFAALEL